MYSLHLILRAPYLGDANHAWSVIISISSCLFYFWSLKRALCFFATLAWVIAQIRFCQLPFARKGGENISERLSKQKIFPFKLAAKISYRLLPSQCHTRWGIILGLQLESKIWINHDFSTEKSWIFRHSAWYWE